MASTTIQWAGDGVHTIGNIATASSTAFTIGEAISLESNVLTKINASTDNSTFIGLLAGESLSTDTKAVPVHRVCVVQTTLVSATYTLGASLIWSASNVYVANATDTLGWIHDQDTATRTSGIVYINVIMLSNSAGMIYDTPAT